MQLDGFVFSAGKKKKVRKNKKAGRSAQSQSAASFNDAEFVGEPTKLEAFTSDAGLLLHYIWAWALMPVYFASCILYFFS